MPFRQNSDIPPQPDPPMNLRDMPRGGIPGQTRAVPPTRPSETARGERWLTNFLPEDRPAATQLLDAIKLARLSTIRVALLARVTELADAGEIREPAMLVSALSIEDLRGPDRGGRRAVAFDNFGLGDAISATPGSEGFVGNLLREALRSRRWLPPTAPLNELRAAKCGSVLLLSDYAGSGTQLRDYAMTLVRHPTIRSWRSGGFVRIQALAFVATSVATELLSSKGSPIDDFWPIEAAPTFDDRPWTARERQAVEELCLRYASGRRDQALGYRSSCGLFAMDTSAPNNLPFVLRRVGAGWQPFFIDRAVPSDIPAELGDYSPGLDTGGLVTATGQQRFAWSVPLRSMRPDNANLLYVLALLNRRAHGSIELSAALGMPLDRTARLLASLEHLGLIDADHRITEAGRAEIVAAKRAPRRVAAPMNPRDEPYYPVTMR